MACKTEVMLVKLAGVKPGFSEWGVTGKAAPSEARRARWLRPEGPKAVVGFLGRESRPVVFLYFECSGMASPINRIRCRDVFS